MKPVCFASVALHDPSTKTCSECPLVKECYAGAMYRIGQMPDLPEVRTERLRLAALATVPAGEGRARVSRRGVARRPLSASESNRLVNLPARARSMASRLSKTGWFEAARYQLNAQENPGTPGSAMEVFLRALLAGPVQRSAVVAMFAAELGMKPSSAQVEASTLISVLEFGGLASMRGGVVTLTPNLAMNDLSHTAARNEARTIQ